MQIVDHTVTLDRPGCRVDSVDQDVAERVEVQAVPRTADMEVNNRTEQTIAIFRLIRWLWCVAIVITKSKRTKGCGVVDHDTERHYCVMSCYS